MYEEFRIKPIVEIYISIINLFPPEGVSSCRPFGIWADPMTFACSLMSTFGFWRSFVAVFSTLAGLSSRTVGPLAICKGLGAGKSSRKSMS